MSSPVDAAVARAEMVERQLRRRGITDERVLASMGRVPRELFVPESLRAHAYEDGALPIGHGQTISQPFVVATICSLLDLDGAERVLDVGTGSGYQAAVLAELAAEVVTIERVPELAEEARARASPRPGIECRGARRRRLARRPRARAVRRDRGGRGGPERAASALRAALRGRPARPPARIEPRTGPRARRANA